MSLNLTRSGFGYRPLASDDAAMVLDWRNRDHVREHMYTDHIITSDEHRRWIEKTIKAADRDYFIFEHLAQPVGLFGLYDIGQEDKRAEFGFYLASSDAEKGSGSAMMFLMVEHAFNVTGLERLCCEALASNTRAIKLYERFGFVHEGLNKGQHVKNGRPQDIVEMALFAKTWAETRDAQASGIFG